ncbi:ABC transporter permease subunit [Curvibacter sp. CHRR-16]|uniref:ABC transporter permease n=1 Tax=Curvibacter sp. CHRR-16 TaxID=2835872 RepID=UPI002023A9C2|nr:ABC transporter permease subunit [Curvibacter sp. CHRR-16]
MNSPTRRFNTARAMAWLVFAVMALFFVVPLVATVEFSLRMRRGEYSFDAYVAVLSDPLFAQAMGFSALVALAAVLIGLLLIPTTAYWVHVKAPAMKPIVEFITLLPLVVPAIVIVFGYLRLYNSSSWLPMTDADWSTNLLLAAGMATLSMPYMYRAVDTGMRTLDVRLLTEAAQTLGASPMLTLWRVILPNIASALLSGSFLTFAIVMGEFTIASLLDRPALGPYLQLVGANKAYEPAALTIVAFAITWACMGLAQWLTHALQRRASNRHTDSQTH